MWPTFTVVKCFPVGTAIGSVDFFTVGKETWVADRYVGYLKLLDSLIFGRWHIHEPGWRFVPDAAHAFAIGDTLTVIDGYWGERVLIATDPTLEWSISVWTDSNDHVHCSICWATISTSAEPNYYQNSSRDTVCATCYQNHVSQRDISFVPVA